MNKLFYLLLLALFLSCGNQEKIYKRSTLSMGTKVEIQIKTNNESLADKAIDSAFLEVQRINDKFSVYNPNSFLNQINSSSIFQLDDETYYIFKKSEFYNKISHGAFDPAIGNIIKALGFESTEPEDIPEDSIRNYLNRNNWKLIQLTEDKKIIKPNDLRINLGAIVKGYAVDRMYEVVKSFGFKSFLVNAGGEIRCSGDIWNVGIQHPRQKDKLLGVIKLQDKSVATSGDYERFRIKDGKRLVHIFNPITCLIADECQSVTIIAENTIDADAIATAVFVLGPMEGLKMVEQINNCEALIVDKNGTIHRSRRINNYFVEQK